MNEEQVRWCDMLYCCEKAVEVCNHCGDRFCSEHAIEDNASGYFYCVVCLGCNRPEGDGE